MGPCYTRQFFLQLATGHKRGIASCENNCSCKTPFSQLAMQQNVALQVARKVELSTFRNIARQVAVCNMSRATCNIFHSSSLRCKLQEKLPGITWPLLRRILRVISARNACIERAQMKWRLFSMPPSPNFVFLK